MTLRVKYFPRLSILGSTFAESLASQPPPSCGALAQHVLRVIAHRISEAVGERVDHAGLAGAGHVDVEMGLVGEQGSVSPDEPSVTRFARADRASGHGFLVQAWNSKVSTVFCHTEDSRDGGHRGPNGWLGENKHFLRVKIPIQKATIYPRAPIRVTLIVVLEFATPFYQQSDSHP